MRLLVVLTAVQVVVNLCLAVERLIVYFARDTLSLGPGAVGVVMAAGGAGGIAGALVRPGWPHSPGTPGSCWRRS